MPPRLSLSAPDPAHSATHNHSPAPRPSLHSSLLSPLPGGKAGASPGRAWDHLRVREPNVITKPFREDGKRWQRFVRPREQELGNAEFADEDDEDDEDDVSPGEDVANSRSRLSPQSGGVASGLNEKIFSPSGPNRENLANEFSPRLPVASQYGDEERIVTYEEMDKLMPGLDLPWRMEYSNPDERLKGWWLFTPERRRKTKLKWRGIIMHSPFVPLVIRLTVLTFSVLALALACSIYRNVLARNNDPGVSGDCEQGSSTYLAIIVDCVAIIYTFLITTDEFRSKPIGLRSATSKVRLIFLDIFFIVFDSANLSLAFHAMTDDSWACTTTKNEGCNYNQPVCDKQKALTATLLVALIAWLVTFGVSIFRVIERISDRRGD